MKKLLLLWLLLNCSTTFGADWLRFRGPDGSGISTDRGLASNWSGTENIAWKTELPGAGTSSPIFVGDRIVLTCYSGYNVPRQDPGNMSDLKRHVVCLDRRSGKLQWSTPVPSKLPEQDKIRDEHGYASNTPVSDGQKLYVFFGKSGVFALTLDGKILWNTSVGEGLNGWGSAASPVIYNNLVVVNASVESESLVALDKSSGKEVWRAGGIKESWNTPILVQTESGKQELVVAIFGKVLAFDPQTGKQLWSSDTDIGWYMVPCIVADKGVVYCIGGRGTGGALAVKTGGRGDVTDTHRVWVGQKGSNVSSPIKYGAHLFWAHESQGIVYCADAATGEIVYEERLPRVGRGDMTIYASPVLADGKIFYLTRSGRTYVVAAKPEFELIATNDFGDRSTFNSSPVVADGRLFVRSDQYLYCVGGK